MAGTEEQAVQVTVEAVAAARADISTEVIGVLLQQVAVERAVVAELKRRCAALETALFQQATGVNGSQEPEGGDPGV